MFIKHFSPKWHTAWGQLMWVIIFFWEKSGCMVIINSCKMPQNSLSFLIFMETKLHPCFLSTSHPRHPPNPTFHILLSPGLQLLVSESQCEKAAFFTAVLYSGHAVMILSFCARYFWAGQTKPRMFWLHCSFFLQSEFADIYIFFSLHLTGGFSLSSSVSWSDYILCPGIILEYPYCRLLPPPE